MKMFNDGKVCMDDTKSLKRSTRQHCGCTWADVRSGKGANVSLPSVLSTLNFWTQVLQSIRSLLLNFLHLIPPGFRLVSEGSD